MRYRVIGGVWWFRIWDTMRGQEVGEQVDSDSPDARQRIEKQCKNFNDAFNG